MNVLWIKLEQDKKSFRIPENLGFEVLKIRDTENIDKKIDELIRKNYNTIILSNEIAGFSQKINKEYLRNKNINIIIDKDHDNSIGGNLE